jgi:hypothetical protein
MHLAGYLYEDYHDVLSLEQIVTPLCGFSLHPTLNLTGVPRNVAFHSVGLSTHTLPEMLQFV